MNRQYTHWRDYPAAEWRWPNFSPREIACRGDNTLMVDEYAMDCLQALRIALGRPLIVNSAYRSPEYNARIGGATASQHLHGRAFDISMTNQEPARFEAAARAAGFAGFGFYPRNNFVHIDTGPKREWGTRWFAEEFRLPRETPLKPERPAEDGSLVGGAVASGGAVAGAGAVLSGIGDLSPVAQVVALVAILAIAGGVVLVMRDRIKAWRP